MTDLFQVLASEQDSTEIRRAVIAAQTRAKERFDKFVSSAATQEERDARIELIASDLDGVLGDVVAEHGGDIETLRNAATVALGGGHASDCSCGFCENKGNLPGSKKDDDEDEDEPMGEKESSVVKTACPNCTEDEECDDCRAKKSSKVDVRQASASASEFPWDETVVASDTTEKLAMAVSKRDFEAIAAILKQNGADPNIAQQIADYFATQNPNFDNDRFMDASGVGQLQAPLASAVIAAVKVADVETGDTYAQERVDLPSNKTDGLGGPSPKIDKGKSGDEAGWDLKPIDAPSERHPSEQQSVEDRADYNAADFDPSSPVRDRVDADAPLQPEHNVADNTETWTGTEGQASPVTSAVLSKWKVLP